MKRLWNILIVVFAIVSMSCSAFADGKTHKVAVHVDQNDKKVMNMALNNVENLTKYFTPKGDKVLVEVVAYGPGLHMLRADTSPVKSRIAAMSLEIDGLKFMACGNTHRKMTEAAKGKTVQLLSEAVKVPSGVVRLIDLQEQGYSYIRP